jgi:hypothetical protein
MAQQIQLRGGTAAEWSAANPVLAEREMGVVTDTQNYKIGDGVTAWNDLPAFQLSPTLGAITLNAVADPSTPSAGQMAFYSKAIAGRLMPKWKGPSGLDTAVQPAVFSNSVMFQSPGAGTAVTVVGMAAPAATGTVSHPNPASGSGLVGTMRRSRVTSAATASSMAYLRNASVYVARGDAADQGGFFFAMRFALQSTLAGKTVIMGLSNNTSLAVGQVPGALVNSLFVGADTGDANLSFYYSGVGAPTKVALGANFPKNDLTAVYELMLFCGPNAGSVHWRVVRLDTGDTVEGEVSINIPAGSVYLSPVSFVANFGVATVVIFDVMRVYMETDY